MSHRPISKIPIILFAISCVCITSACDSIKRTTPVIEKSMFVQIYCDVVVRSDQLSRPEQTAFVDSVLSAHQVTKEQFDQTVQYYSQNSERWKQIFDDITSELERRLNLPSDKSDGKEAVEAAIENPDNQPINATPKN
jgi:hypothetical protein